jgi:predicted outer membrane repeat protein
VHDDLALNTTQFLSNTSNGRGGALYARGIAVLHSGLFQNNRCLQTFCDGGGLLALDDLRLFDTNFISNTSVRHGAGAFAYGINAALTGGLFQDNHCSASDCAGGGLYSEANLTLTSTRFISNSSLSQGGGVFVFGPVVLSGIVFQGNQCTLGSCMGGGLYASDGVELTASQFLDNQANEGGGLAQPEVGNGTFSNGLFAGNQAASGHGAALYLGSNGNIRLLHTTIASTPLGSGAAVYVTSGTVALTNTLIANYQVGIERTAGTVHEDYSLFSGVGAPVSGLISGGTHSHTGAAGFVNPAAGNFHLGLGSAALDAGTDAGVSIDVDGQARPLAGGFDIGFDELYFVKVFLPLLMR